MDKITIGLDDADMIMLEHAGDKDIVFNFVARTLEGRDFRVIIKRETEQHQAKTVGPECFDIGSDLKEEDLTF